MTLAVKGIFPIHSNCPDELHHLAAVTAKLSKWIYYPHHADSLTLKNMSAVNAYFEVIENGQQVGKLKVRPCETETIKLKAASVKLRKTSRIGKKLFDVEVAVGREYEVADLAVKCRSIFPEGYSSGRIHEDEGMNPVQWTIVTSDDGKHAIVVFRGTKNAKDMVIDGSGMIADRKNELDLCVNSSIWGALHTSTSQADVIISELRDVAVGREVVICGHSLGGGYAMLFGLKLLSMDMRVDAVLSHGGPMVIEPPGEGHVRGRKLWDALSAVSRVYVNEFDMIPRLPSCRSWVFDVIPRVMGLQFGPLRVNLDKSLLEDNFGSRFSLFGNVRHAGLLFFISDGCSTAESWKAESEDAMSRLDKAPEEIVDKNFNVNFFCPQYIITHHLAYHEVTAQLGLHVG